jgi:hypothetical protein
LTTEAFQGEGNLKPMIQFHNIQVAKYWIASPSRFRSGHILQRQTCQPLVFDLRRRGAYLKTATLLTNTPHSQTADPGAADDIKIVRGRRGRRIDFSCTWKENRKKEREVVKRA